MIRILDTSFSTTSLQEFMDAFGAFYDILGEEITAIILPFLETLLPILPLFIMIAFNIWKLGLIKGYIFTAIGTILGMIFIFLVVRFFARRRQKMNKPLNKTIRHTLTWIEETNPILHIFVLSIPLAPTLFINYSMGATQMKFTRFLVITVISRCIMLLICIPFGMTLVSFYNEGVYGTVNLTWLAVSGFVALVSVILGKRIVAKIKNT